MAALYVFDTCAILETWVRNFPRDVAPGLWERLEALMDEGVIVAPDEVFEEIARKEDDVHEWAKARRERLFVPIDDRQAACVREIVNGNPNMLKSGRNRADPFVIALAEVKSLTVVTEEGLDGSDRRPKVPYVCGLRSVPCTNVVGLMREQGWELH